MKLYIGNATRQIFDFVYMTIGQSDRKAHRRQLIQPGSQILVSGSENFSPEEIDYIVKQHVAYGMIESSAIDRTRAYHGTCYSIGKPITEARLTYLMDHNIGELVDQGRVIRQANAIAQNDTIARALTESGRPERMSALDMTVQQENEDPKNDVPQFSVGTIVTNDAAVAGSGRRGAARGRRNGTATRTVQ